MKTRLGFLGWRHLGRLAWVGIVALLAGCDVLTFRVLDFPNAETGENGEIYMLDDLSEIANDPDLTDDEKRDAFRELGIEDENLIEALLTLS